jgi:general secretion pathway protein L
VAGNRLAENIVTTTLRVFVGERWPLEPTTRWALFDDAGRLQRSGESGVLHWPAADQCEAVISAPQLACLRAPIPERISRRDLMTVVASTLEDRLLDDIDQCHLTVCRRRRGAMDVLVIARSRLRNVLAQFAALKRPLSAAYSELQTSCATERGWALAMADDGAILHRPEQPVLTLDLADDLPPVSLPPLLASARAQGSEPTLSVLPRPGQSLDLGQWRTLLDLQAVTLGPEYHWYDVASGAADLLHDEFASSQPGGASWRAIRPILAVAAALICIQVVVGSLQVGWQHHVISGTEARMAQLFRASFPNVPIVAPLAQTRQQLDQLRTVHGQLRSDDALLMLAVVADVLGADALDSLGELNYENRSLSLLFQPRAAARVGDLQRQLVVRGYAATLQPTADGRSRLIVRQEMAR